MCWKKFGRFFRAAPRICAEKNARIDHCLEELKPGQFSASIRIQLVGIDPAGAIRASHFRMNRLDFLL
jgi:hypothetical protein